LSNRGEVAVDEGRGDRHVLLYVMSTLLVASTVSWRRGTYFSGSFDPVVVLKAAVSGTALALAILSLGRTTTRTPIGPRSIAFLTAFLATTCLGGWAAGTTFPSIVLALRVAILAAVIICLLQAYAVDTVISVMVRVIAATALLGVVSGARTLTSGRLSGGIPPLSPNELAFLCGVVVLALVWRVVEGTASHWDWTAIAALLGVVWLTGSRTGLVALAAAAVLMMFQTRALATPLFLGLVALLPVGGYVFFATNTLSSLFERGGNQNISTLSSRTIAWDAALQFDISWWQEWFGGGLAMKRIPVVGQYWKDQILDSSWISALVQGGLIGLTLAGLWICTAVVASLYCDRRWRSLWLGLLMFLVSRSFLESGLFDATPAFLLLMMVSVMSEKASRTAGHHLVVPARSRRSPLALDG